MLVPAKLGAFGLSEAIALGIGLLLAAWGSTLFVATRRWGLTGILAGTAGGFTVTFATLMMLLVAIMPQFTTRSLVEYIRPGLEGNPRAEVLSVGYIQSVPFYAGRRSEVLGAPDELELGVAQMPHHERREWVFEGEAKLENLQEEMRDKDPVYVFVEVKRRKPKKIQRLLQEVGYGAAPIISNQGFFVFGNRAAQAATPPVSSEARERTALLPSANQRYYRRHPSSPPE
jgi:hypothetical protein